MVAPPRTRRGPTTTSRPAWHRPRPHSGCPHRRCNGPASWGATPMGTVHHQKNGGTPQTSFRTPEGTPDSSHPTGPRPCCPRCVGRPHPRAPRHRAQNGGRDGTLHQTTPEYGTPLQHTDAKRHRHQQHNRNHYYLQALHERSTIIIYTFTTYPGLHAPQHHPRLAGRHPLHVAPTLRKRPAHHAPPRADSTALYAARRRAAVHHQSHLLPRTSADPITVTEATHKSTMNLLARKLRP